MKQWKLVLVALLSVLLVCTCMSALADSHEHVWDYENPTYHEATCTKGSYNTWGCSAEGCTATKDGDIINPATGHNLKDVIMTKVAPTCKTNGYTVWVCGNNGCTYEVGRTVEEASSKYHSWSDWATTTEATCTVEGWQTRRCSTCGQIDQKNLGYKYGVNGHVYGTTPVSTKAATCYANGEEVYACVNCGAKTTKTIKATGNHNYTKWGYEYTGSVKPTCTTAGTQTAKCQNEGCGKIATQKVNALGHDLKTTVTDSTCSATGKKVTVCKNGCEYYAEEVIAKKKHSIVEVVTAPALCKESGLKYTYCSVCDQVIESNIVIPATGHKGKWVVTTAATAKKDGEKQLICQNRDANGKLCGEVLDKKTVKYAEMMYNNTITGFGPCTRDLIGGKTWNRVTPVDLSVDGTYTYDLVASNKYVVGTLVVTVANGTMTVNYELNATQIKVNEETLTIYANLDALKNGMGLTATVGTPIDVAANFGEDTKVIVAFAAKADYNAVGAGVSSFKADDAQLAALMANID